MAEQRFESDYLLDWADLVEHRMSLRDSGQISVKEGRSRLHSEAEDQREKRLKLSRECAARRRSMEMPFEREKRLKEQREKMAEKRRLESAEERELRLKRAREREAERRRTESAEKREKRLRESREKAAFRRRQETSEERERRLETSRIRAAQRRQELKQTSSESRTDSTSLKTPTAVSNSKPRHQRKTRRRNTSGSHRRPSNLNSDDGGCEHILMITSNFTAENTAIDFNNTLTVSPQFNPDSNLCAVASPSLATTNEKIDWFKQEDSVALSSPLEMGAKTVAELMVENITHHLPLESYQTERTEEEAIGWASIGRQTECEGETRRVAEYHEGEDILKEVGHQEDEGETKHMSKKEEKKEVGVDGNEKQMLGRMSFLERRLDHPDFGQGTLGQSYPEQLQAVIFTSCS